MLVITSRSKFSVDTIHLKNWTMLARTEFNLRVILPFCPYSRNPNFGTYTQCRIAWRMSLSLRGDCCVVTGSRSNSRSPGEKRLRGQKGRLLSSQHLQSLLLYFSSGTWYQQQKISTTTTSIANTSSNSAWVINCNQPSSSKRKTEVVCVCLSIFQVLYPCHWSQ